jgi:hypothetical protein
VKESVASLVLLLGGLAVSGCSSPRMQLGAAPEVQTRADLLRSFGPPDRIFQLPEGEEWRYSARRLSLWHFTRTSRRWSFLLDAQGHVLQGQFTEVIREYGGRPSSSLTLKPR